MKYVKKGLLRIIFVVLLFVLGSLKVFAQPSVGVTCMVQNNSESVTVSGKISSGANQQVTLLVNAPNGEVAYIDQMLSGADGAYRFSFKLSATMPAGTYQVKVSGRKVVTPATAEFNYQLSEEPQPVTVTAAAEISDGRITVSGRISSGANQQVTLLVNAPNGEVAYIDQMLSGADGAYRFSFKLSATMPAGTYQVKVSGRKVVTPATVAFTYEGGAEPAETEYTYRLTGEANEVVRLFARIKENSSFENKIFSLAYRSEQVEPVSFFGAYSDDSIGCGVRGNVEITAFEPGKIKFKILNTKIPQNKVWSGVLNIFKFKFLDGYSGETVFTISR